MHEREQNDPTQETRDLARRIIATLSHRTAERLAEHRANSHLAQAWESSAAAEQRDTDEVTAERRDREARRRTAFLDALTDKLNSQGMPITPNERLLLSLLIASLPGSWNEYDGDDVTLGNVSRTETTVTVTCESYGYEVGRTTLPLALE